MSRSSLAVLATAALTLAGCDAQTLDTTQTTPPQQVQEPQAQAQQPRPTPVTTPAAPRPVPAPPPAPARVSLPAGTVLDVQLAQELDSGTNRTGDAFEVTVMTPVVAGGETVVPVGSIVRGTLDEVKAAKRGRGRASMTLRFEELELPSGYRTPIAASFSEETGGKKKRNAAIIGGSAAGGAILGRVLGNDNKDAAIGAILGGAIATGVVLSREGDQVELPAGSAFSIQLTEGIEVPLAPPTS